MTLLVESIESKWKEWKNWKNWKLRKKKFVYIGLFLLYVVLPSVGLGIFIPEKEKYIEEIEENLIKKYTPGLICLRRQEDSINVVYEQKKFDLVLNTTTTEFKKVEFETNKDNSLLVYVENTKAWTINPIFRGATKIKIDDDNVIKELILSENLGSDWKSKFGRNYYKQSGSDVYVNESKRTDANMFPTYEEFKKSTQNEIQDKLDRVNTNIFLCFLPWIITIVIIVFIIIVLIAQSGG